VKLLDRRKYDRCLDDERTKKAVASLLGSIQLLLSESDGLQTRYGLKRVEKQPTIVQTISKPYMDQFLHESRI
jgi:hypothetical protein